MINRFKDDDAGYLAWVRGHPAGFVVNVDDPLQTPRYPMVHSASHKAVSSPARDNYTTGRYIKVCSIHLGELEQWAQSTYGRPLVHCSQCM